MAIEYERKFAATPALLQQLQQLSDAWVCYRMQTTYYDAPDGSLSARKWMLRHRLENEHHVCTLKTPAGDARGEWEVEAERIEDAIEKLIRQDTPEDLPALTAKGVRPICGARFQRLAALFVLDRATVEVALDNGILFAGDNQAPLCEAEVELKSGDREAADAFICALIRRFDLQEVTDSKFKRARALI